VRGTLKFSLGFISVQCVKKLLKAKKNHLKELKKIILGVHAEWKTCSSQQQSTKFGMEFQRHQWVKKMYPTSFVGTNKS
jgi:hypothetical protein